MMSMFPVYFIQFFAVFLILTGSTLWGASTPKWPTHLRLLCILFITCGAGLSSIVPGLCRDIVKDTATRQMIQAEQDHVAAANADLVRRIQVKVYAATTQSTTEP